MADTTRDRMLATGLFQQVGQSRDLFCETTVSTENVYAIRTVFRFDSFGDIVGVEAHIVDNSMRAIVAQNLRALGLPSQGNT